MAYLDGQMSASEALDFEASLAERDRARLQGEVRLEAAIGERLSCSGSGCPAALWESLAAQLAPDNVVPLAAPPARPSRLAYWVSRTSVVVAATLAIVVGAPYYEAFFITEGQRPGSVVAITKNTTREQFSQGLQAPASLAAAQKFLHDHNIPLRLGHSSGAESGHRHDIEFLGICRGRCPEGTLFELRFWCCNEPAKLFVARRGTEGEQILRAAFDEGEALECLSTDDFVAAVVGGHSSLELARLVQPIRGNLT